MSDDHSLFLIEVFSDWLAGVNTADLLRLRDALAKELATRVPPALGTESKLSCGMCGMTFQSVSQITSHRC